MDWYKFANDNSGGSMRFIIVSDNKEIITCQFSKDPQEIDAHIYC